MKLLQRYAMACAITMLPLAASAQISLNKPAFQSSDYDVNHMAAKAVDGNTDGDFYHNSITHTNADQNAYWYVDLGSTSSIGSIDVFNRTDGFGSRLNNFFVSVLAAGTPNVGSFTAPTVWSQFFSGTPFNEMLFTAPAGTQGRYVKIQFDHTDYLQLAEVTVNAAPGTPGTSTVPEPSSMALLGTGLVGLVPMLRRSRRSA
ncbi:MAG: discoidin domain-containing protein [Gemmatimonadaceae bacterium]